MSDPRGRKSPSGAPLSRRIDVRTPSAMGPRIMTERAVPSRRRGLRGVSVEPQRARTALSTRKNVRSDVARKKSVAVPARDALSTQSPCKPDTNPPPPPEKKRKRGHGRVPDGQKKAEGRIAPPATR